MELLSKGILLFLVAILSPVNSLFVPEQLPTLLSFIYTNIPPIRKGIDSRVGFGFRLGPNADVQVTLELGPQQNTAPVGPQKADGNSKRETRRPPYKYRGPVKGSWLHAWRQQQTVIDDEEDVGVMPAQPAMDSDVLAHLHQLYKEQPMPESAKSPRRTKKLKHSPKRPQGSVPIVQTRASQVQEPTRNNEASPEPTQLVESEQQTINGGVVEGLTTRLVTNDQINNVPT